MAEVKWLDTQESVINEKEGEILVSASAGSGKTSVMIERLIRLIEDGVSVDEVLCLTFTESAAQEIKDRLKTALIKRLAGSTGEQRERFLRELDRLAFSDISTIDAFCKRITSRYFEKAGIDPSFSIASSDESGNIKYRVAEKILSSYGEKNDATYMELLDFFGKKRTETSVLNTIIRIDNYLSSIAGREEFVSNVIAQTEKEPSQTLLLQEEIQKIGREIRTIEGECFSVRDYDLPYPSEVLAFLGKVRESLADGFERFFEEIKKEKPESPNYNKKIYKDVKYETYDSVTFIKNRFNAFVEKYSSYSYEKIKEDLVFISKYAKKLFEIIQEFRIEYEKAMNRVNLMDFAMIEDRAKICLMDEEVRRDTVARYTHVLVDEYQDTNKLQDEIISLCSGGKSLFMVGDTKQSIYEFRHADSTLFAEKKNKAKIKAHTLTENFRTDEKVIDAINRIFKAIYLKEITGEDYAKQVMKAQNKGIYGGFPPVSFRVFLTTQRKSDISHQDLYSVQNAPKEIEIEEEREEVVFVYNKIKSLLKSAKIKDKDGVERNIKPSDIAILYRDRSGVVRELIEKFRREGMPATISEKSKLPYSAELLLHLLKVVDNPLREDSLVCALLSPLFDFKENELAKYKVLSKKNSLWESLLEVREKFSKVNDFLTKIEKYKFRSGYESVASLVDYIIKDIDLEGKIASMDEGSAELGELEIYLASLRGSKIANSLSEYLNYFDKYPEFSSNRVSGSGDGIRFMTVHASKGLEFPIVFLVSCGSYFNKTDMNESILLHKKYGIAMPSFDSFTRKYTSSIFMDSIKDQMNTDTISQELKLLYVALTRARNMLFITGKSRSTKKESAQNKKSVESANCFLDFLITAINIDLDLENVIDYKYGPEEIENEEEIVQTIEKSEKISCQIDENLLKFCYPHQRATVTSSKFTVTGVLKEDEFETPSVKLTDSVSAEVGTLYHTVMEHVDFSVSDEEKLNLALDKMVLDEIITKEEKKSLDIKVLLRVLNLPIIKDNAHKKMLKEQAFLLRAPLCDIIEGEIQDEVLLQGVIDLVIMGDTPIIVDYKFSGASKETLIKRYQKQLDLYAYSAKKILNVEKVKKYLLSLKTGEIVEFEDK